MKPFGYVAKATPDSAWTFVWDRPPSSWEIKPVYDEHAVQQAKYVLANSAYKTCRNNGGTPAMAEAVAQTVREVEV